MKKDFQINQKPSLCDRLKQKTTVLLSLIVLLMTLGMSCSSERAENHKIKMLVSILPQKYFVEQIAGDLADVLVLIPPGSSPHSYDPSPRQMRDINQVDIYFYNGYLSFEQPLLNALRTNNPDLKTVMLTAGVELIAGHECSHDDHEHDHHHDGVDPHTWLSVKNAKIKALNILKALSELYPHHIDAFMENYGEFEERLMKLEDSLNRILAETPNRTFMIYHPALGYFALDHDLEQLTIEYEGKEPTPAQLKNSIKNAREAGVKVIFVQKEFDAQNALLVAREIGGKVIELDPLSEQWHDNMLEIAKIIQSANN